MLTELAHSISYVYQWSVIIGVLSLACILMMGKAKLKYQQQPSKKHNGR